ncbi:MAG: glycosyltransferase family 2 protein [Opitutae bacterium]|jgi:glycosyltransferase involved in cell wall biosynthesis|nr:glycosyltransferase family 2 protein [Opitutae bacterium]
MNELKIPISLVIPCKNEESNLARCLKSVKWVGEVFVVDSQSTDRTVEIAEEFGAQIVQFDYKGGWPKKKNWALESLPFTYEWVLILDADECLPPEAEEEIRGIVTNAKDKHSGYWINRRYFFMGKALKHAYFPNWNLRLFKHKLGRYEKITDLSTDSGDHEIHEHVVVQGSTGRLKSIMDHHAFPTIESFVEKHNRYSNWEAIVENEQKEKADLIQHNEVKLKRKLRMFFRKLPFRPTLRFLYVYIWQKGFLDGWAGYVFARLHGQYEFLTKAKTRERLILIQTKDED